MIPVEPREAPPSEAEPVHGSLPAAAPGSEPEASRALPWRKRRPVLARLTLYGAAVAVLGAGGLVAAHVLESARQEGLLTRIQGAEQLREVDPERTLKTLDEDVLAKEPGPDVRMRALLARAAALDSLHRFDEARRGYAALDGEWPKDTPKGPLYVPWANLLVRAGYPKDALEMLARPAATDGWPADEVEGVRRLASQALASQR